MNYRERMKEYLKEPDEYSPQYGKWGILNKDQRDLIKRLLREMDSADEVIKHQFFEIERLNNRVKQLEKSIMISNKKHSFMTKDNIKLRTIINELDNMFYETFRIRQNGYYSISEWELKDFTDKLQELKGEDKE